MSPRRTIQIQCLVLLVAAAFRVETGCTPGGKVPTLLSGPASTDGMSQDYATEVDGDGDGVADASDSGVLVTGPTAPGELSQSASGHSATLELTSDDDTILLTCRHQLVASAGSTQCSGTARAGFDIAVPSTSAEFTFVLAATPASEPAGTTQSAGAQLSVDCGAGPEAYALDLNVNRTTVAEAPVASDADSCLVIFTLDPSRVDTTGAEAAEVVHSVSVTARDVAPVECSDASACPPDEPVCGPDGLCQEGTTGDACDIPALHCDPDHQVCNTGCSGGHAGSPCRYDGDCADGTSCVAGVCEGAACNADADCDGPDAELCTPSGCSPEGARGDGCFTSSGCQVANTCVGGRCNAIVGEGEDCSGENVLCEVGFNCLSSTGTCEEPLGTGEACVENAQCDLSFDSCINGVCAARSNEGGACDDDLDCFGFLKCSGGVCSI